ncbi:MAG: DUF3422 family protein [Candidatus Methylumidiphilus sp.]
MRYLTECPERRGLNDEIHARPYLELNPPEQVSYIALLVDKEARARELAHLRSLCAHYQAPAPDSLDSKEFYVDCGAFRLKMELHAEFTHYKFLRQTAFSAPFADPVIATLPADWLEGLPGKLLIGVHVAIVDAGQAGMDLALEALPQYFDGNRLVGGKIAGGNGAAYSDFMIHDDGFSRLLIVNDGFAPGQGGRCMQRLLEIETYRMMALLGLPVARAILPQLPEADRQLVTLTAALADGQAQSDEALLAELTRLAAKMENTVSATYARFNATRSYAALVESRLEQLRESKIEGIPTFNEVLTRRIDPAMATCQAVDQWLHQLTQRIANVNQLLLARIDVRRKQQNQDILESMNRRASLQLRLQQALEGLSVAAITYAAVSLLGLVLNGAKSIGIHINAELAMTLAIPVVGYFVYLGVSGLHESIQREDQGRGP